MKSFREHLVPCLILAAWFFVATYTLNQLRGLQAMNVPRMAAPAMVITR